MSRMAPTSALRLLRATLGALVAVWLPSTFATPGPLLATPAAPYAPSVFAAAATDDPERFPSPDETARAFAAAWASGSGDRIARLLSPEGVRLHLDGGAPAMVGHRQAVASVREFLRGFQNVSARVVRAAAVEGSPDRGFAEIRWMARASGTSQEVGRNLFVGMALEGDRWTVNELRLLR